jgi:hypothetical protein
MQPDAQDVATEIVLSNNSVAQSDLDAAIAVIVSKSKSPALSDALVSHLQRIVQPMPDADFHRAKRSTSLQDSTSTTKSPTSTIQAPATLLVDPDLLLDTQAQDRVQAIRKRVRDQAHALSTARNAVLERAAHVARLETQLLVGPVLDQVYLQDFDDSMQEVPEDKIQRLIDLRQVVESIQENKASVEGIDGQTSRFGSTLRVLESFVENSKPSKVDAAIQASPESRIRVAVVMMRILWSS